MVQIQIPADSRYLAITFPVQENFSIGSEETGLVVTREDTVLTVRLFYSFSPNPLTLTAQTAQTDSNEQNTHAQLVVRPQRIELFTLSADGTKQLCDEEWPCGTPLFAGKALCSDHAMELNTCEPETPQPPAVTRRFSGVGNICPPGVNVGDCMPFSELNAAGGGERYHLFYLYDRHHHRSKWGLGAHQWAHISTCDFVHWDEHPMAVPISEPWEGSICTGSVFAAEGKLYAWYAVRMADHSPARLTNAVAADGAHFVKSGKFFTLPAAYETSSARDPKVFFFGGRYHMLVTTTRLADNAGCLAHLSSPTLDDWTKWEDCGAAFLSPDGSQPECPDWFEWNGRFYLVVGLHGKGCYYMADAPFGPWRASEENLIPCGNVPKSALLGKRRIFAGFSTPGGYAGELLTVEATQQPDGTLHFQ